MPGRTTLQLTLVHGLLCTTELRRAAAPVLLSLSCHQVRPLTSATLRASLEEEGQQTTPSH